MRLLDRAHDMLDSLKLSDAQEKKIDELFEKTKADLQQRQSELRKLEPRERIAQMMKVMENLRQQVSAELTDDQRAEFQKKVEDARDRMRAATQRAGAGEAGRAGGAGGAGGGRAGAAGGPIDRLRNALPQLDLSQDQRERIRDLLQDAQSKGMQIRTEFQDDMQQLRQKMMQLMQDTRQKMQTILTPQQLEKLRELMRQSEGATSRPAGGAGAGERPFLRERRGGGAGAPSTRANAGDMKNNEMMENAMAMEGGSAAGGKETYASAEHAAASTMPAIGQPAPSFELKKLEGPAASLSNYKGHVVVLEFGSYTSPSFRQRAAAMEQIKHDLGARAQFLVIYTKEAHPKGNWEVERNKEEKIEIAQHKDLADRKAAALKAKQDLKLSRPILLDDMNNSAAHAYGAGADTVVVIAKDGTIAGRQQWADPSGLRRLVEAALNEKS
jgi:hypothetical protein